MLAHTIHACISLWSCMMSRPQLDRVRRQHAGSVTARVEACRSTILCGLTMISISLYDFV